MKWVLFISVLRQSFCEIFFDFISLTASLVTIYFAYFNKQGFNPTALLDWVVVVIIIFALCMFIRRLYNIMFKWDMLILPKDVFFKYIAYQAERAGNEIKNIAGDLSWLESQRDTYASIAKSRNLHIVIYYSSERVSNNERTKSLIEEYKQNNIQMIPYPSDIQPKHVKGILIDMDENSKFLSFTKVNDGESILFKKYYYDTNEYYIATAFIDCIEKYIKLKAEYEVLSVNNN